MFLKFQSVNSGDGSKSSGSSSGSDMVKLKDMLSKKLSFEPPKLISSGESKYLTPLWVFGNGDLSQQLPRSDSSQSTLISFEMGAENSNQNMQEKIKAVLKLLTFREPHVLVQFWWPHAAGKHQLLQTIDQPYGLGVIDEGLCSYRNYSERNIFVLNKDHEEEDGSPPARVFRRGLPEWTFDLTNYLPEYFPRQDFAIYCNLNGYLALPVFDSTTGLCVGVLELLTGSKHTSYAYEVQQVHRALKTVNLTTLQPFDYPSSDVPNERRQNELDNIFSFLKAVCDTHSLPLAQTWAISPLGSYVSNKKMLEKSCNSFDTKCVGKVCMSTASLPFHVKDLHKWQFREECKVRHLEKSQGVVGRALLSRGSCFCGDMTKLGEEEYPLFHYARKNGLTSCFAIFLHSVEGNDDYVLEFFLPFEMEDGKAVPNVVQTLKQNIEAASGFELGDYSSIQVLGLPREVSSLSVNVDPRTIEISSATTTNTKIFEFVSSDSESMVTNFTTTDSANIENQWSSKRNYSYKSSGIITSTEILAGDNVTRDDINVVGASENDNTTSLTNMCMQKMSDNVTGTVEKSSRLKQVRKRKRNSLTMDAVKKHLGEPIDLAAKSLDVSRSTLKRFCREHGLHSWPYSKLNKKATQVTDLKLSSNLHFGISFLVFLLVRVKRWRKKCLIGNAMQNRDHPAVSESTENLRYKANIIDTYSHADWQVLETVNPFSKHALARLGIYEAALIVMGLKRWRKRSVVMNANNNSLVDSQVSDSLMMFHASPKKNSVYGSDTTKVTVKAKFKDDTIKFQFPISSSLLQLENEVAQRIKLNSRKFRLKYTDEDDDMILLGCDADLHNLLGFSGRNNTSIRLIIQAGD